MAGDKKMTRPRIHETCFIDDEAVIIGDVIIAKKCSVWPNAVVRGDQNSIKIDEGSNVQDCCVIHTSDEHAVTIGKNVSIGHGAIIHGATIDDDCLIGMNATVLNEAHVGEGCIIGANALVKNNIKIPPNSLVVGIPGKIVKQNDTFKKRNQANAERYQKLAAYHKDSRYPRYNKQ